VANGKSVAGDTSLPTRGGIALFPFNRLMLKSRFGVTALALSAVGLAACSSGISKEEAEAKDSQIAQLQSQVQTLQGELSGVQKDARYWQ
jgi:hypothetical protein